MKFISDTSFTWQVSSKKKYEFIYLGIYFDNFMREKNEGN